jgi:ankyrin repeat protein
MARTKQTARLPTGSLAPRAIIKGRTPLHRAVENGQFYVAQRLIKHKAGINRKDSGGYTALHLAALNRDKKVAQLLLAAKADPNAKESFGKTPLHLAAGIRDEAVAYVLLQSAVEIRAKDNQSRVALDYAVAVKNWTTVRLLLERGGELEAGNQSERVSSANCVIPERIGDDETLRLLKHGAQYYPYSREPALHIAARNGYNAVILRLLKEQGACVGAEDGCGMTALHLTAAFGHKECLLILLDHKADVNKKDSRLKTALHHAALKRHDELVLLLLGRGADIGIQDLDGETVVDILAKRDQAAAAQTVRLLLTVGSFSALERALLIIARNGYATLLQAFFNEKPEFCTGHWTWKRSALCEAASNGQERIVRLLLKYDTRPDRNDPLGRAPIDLALRRGHLPVVRLLLGAKPDLATEDFRATALCYAVSGGEPDMVQFLLEIGAKPTVHDSLGRSPIYLAFNRGHASIIWLLLDKSDPDKVESVIQNCQGMFPKILLAAACGGIEDIVRFLLEHGAETDVRDGNLWTPLHRTIEGGYATVASLLIKHGADVNAKDDMGRTPLHHATRVGNIALAKVLLDNGADINVVSVEGKRALDMVKLGGDHDTPIIGGGGEEEGE